MIRSNLMGPYTQGVPSPYVAHVHPWPTRFHGPIYTRPVFAFPWVESPQAVFKPDDFSPNGDEDPDRETGTAGLGDLQFQTGRGIFRPGGRGGGVFDGTLAGLGAAMSNGILSGSGSMGILAPQRKIRRPVQGLGAEIPWQCWDKPGFKDCHDSNYVVAQERCASAAHRTTYGYASVDACVKDEVYYADKGNCGCSEMTGSAAPAASTTKTDEEYWANTKQAQTRLNELLSAKGYCPITVDGKIGPSTCGAAKAVGARPPAACTTFKTPALKSTGCGSGSSVATSTVITPALPPPSSPVPYDSASMGGGSNKTLLFALAGAATFGALYLWTKRKKKAA